MRSFKHSGDVGDIIYSLAAVRVVGGGDFYLSKSNVTRLKMSPASVANITPLLRAQPYIRSVEPYCGGSVAYDFDLFRVLLSERISLAVAHLKRFGLPESAVDEPWLSVTARTDSPKVVLARTARYHNDHFPWTKVVRRYRDCCGFVGSSLEWETFCRAYGHVPHLTTPTLLELAETIAGCRLFIGNQSTPYAIAEGLKKDSIQEVCLFCPNCVFERPNAQYVAGERIELPQI